MIQQENLNINYNHRKSKKGNKEHDKICFDINKIQKFGENNFNDVNKYNNDKNVGFNDDNDNYEIKKENSFLRKNDYSKNESYLELFNSQIINKVYKVANKPPEKKRYSVYNKNNNKHNYSIQKYKNTEVITKKHKKKLFPFFYFFLDVFIDKLDKPKTFCCLKKKYLIVYNYTLRIFNISTYILMFKFFNVYKDVVNKNLNEININKKININDQVMMDNIEDKTFNSNYEDCNFI